MKFKEHADRRVRMFKARLEHFDAPEKNQQVYELTVDTDIAKAVEDILVITGVCDRWIYDPARVIAAKRLDWKLALCRVEENYLQAVDTMREQGVLAADHRLGSSDSDGIFTENAQDFLMYADTEKLKLLLSSLENALYGYIYDQLGLSLQQGQEQDN